MKPREQDPLRLDVAALAAGAELLQGQWPLAELPRLADAQACPPGADAGVVRWRARGELRQRPGSAAQPWLHLELDTAAWLTCQRCLQPMAVTLALTPVLRFVPGEAQAEAEDADSEEDVLALPRQLDLRELAEDELLLALPLVPRHASCPQPLPLPPSEPEAPAGEAEADNPFAALARLKRGA
jgi:uncharacterized protein